MLYSLVGKLIIKSPRFVVVEVGGFGFEIFISSRTFQKMPKPKSRVKLFCYVYNYQNTIEIYGFLEEKEREVFELLNSVNGIGPKAALKILDEMKIESLLSAISRGRSDLLTRAVGIGRKKAAKIILELGDRLRKQKVELGSESKIKSLEVDFELVEILRSLGYKQNEIKVVLNKIPPGIETLQEKIKLALKILHPLKK